MADRILITQQLQNSNVALTQASILTTMNNMVALSDSFNSIAYNLTLGQLNDDTQDLVNELANVGLTETNMASELAQIESSTTFVLNKTLSLYTTMMLTSQGASHYINGDTLTLLGDLSNIHQALAASLEAYAQAIELLSPVTDNVILRDATASMLRLAKDIGIMSDRIMEMTDNIIVMADNIGLMADRILLTQELQNQNVELTLNSILQTQTNTLALVSVVEDSSYDVDFARLISEGELLAARMGAVAFSPWTLDDQLAAVRDDVKVFLADIQSVQDALINDGTMNTLYISYDALIQLGNLSLMLTSLASAVDAYVIAIEGLQAFTSSATLADAMSYNRIWCLRG